MHSFYRIIFYLIIYILSQFPTNRIPSCLSSRVDMVSNLDMISMIFTLFNNYLVTSIKRLGNSIINFHRNYAGFYIESALNRPPLNNRTGNMQG